MVHVVKFNFCVQQRKKY